MVAVAALAERAVSKDRDVEFVAPRDTDCSAYLHRMGLGSILDGLGIDHGLRSVLWHPTGDRLLELQRFDAQTEAADDLAEQVYRIFASDDEDQAATLYDAVNEVAQNVVDHSDRQGGYVALQQFRKSSEVSFAVADSGVGLLRKLSTKYTVRDHAHAIGMAVRRGISTKPDGGGVGLHSFVGHTKTGGRVQVWSGDASGSFQNGNHVPALTRHRHAFPGTVAQARLGVP